MDDFKQAADALAEQAQSSGVARKCCDCKKLFFPGLLVSLDSERCSECLALTN